MAQAARFRARRTVNPVGRRRVGKFDEWVGSPGHGDTFPSTAGLSWAGPGPAAAYAEFTTILERLAHP
jgi:hypothetical protein